MAYLAYSQEGWGQWTFWERTWLLQPDDCDFSLSILKRFLMFQRRPFEKTPFYYPTKKGKLHYAGVCVGACKAQFTVFHLCLFFVCFCIYIYFPRSSELNVGHRSFYFCNSFCIKHFDWCLFLFCMSYNVPCLIFLNMFCIVLYAYTLICLYICLKWTHFITTAMFLTSHECQTFSQRHAAFSFAIRMDLCSLQRHFPLLHCVCFKWESPSDMPYWICVEWQKSVQLGNIFKMFIT